MHFNQAIILLAQSHNARLVAHYATESGIQGQLSTGLPDQPFIAVNDSQVCADDVFSILEAYDNPSVLNHWIMPLEWEPSHSFNYAPTPTPESCQEWGLEPSFA